MRRHLDQPRWRPAGRPAARVRARLPNECGMVSSRRYGSPSGGYGPARRRRVAISVRLARRRRRLSPWSPTSTPATPRGLLSSTWRDGVAACPSLRPRARLAAVRVCAGVPASRWCHSFAPRRAVASRAAAKRELQARPPCARRIWSPRAALFAFSANHTFSSLLATACQFQTPLRTSVRYMPLHQRWRTSE